MRTTSIEEKEEGKATLDLLSVIYDFEEKKVVFPSSFFMLLLVSVYSPPIGN